MLAVHQTEDATQVDVPCTSCHQACALDTLVLSWPAQARQSWQERDQTAQGLWFCSPGCIQRHFGQQPVVVMRGVPALTAMAEGLTRQARIQKLRRQRRTWHR
jgi:hypothetical protein